MARKSVSPKAKSPKRSTSTAKKQSPKKQSPKSRKSTPGSLSSKAKTKKTTKTKSGKAGDKEVTLDRRQETDRRSDESVQSVALPIERREKVQRRRQIDPTTCERDYSAQEVDFMKAMDEYKRQSGRMFPTCSEVLEVIRDLGYVQLTPIELAAHRGDEEQASPVDADQSLSADEDLEAVVASEFGQF